MKRKFGDTVIAGLLIASLIGLLMFIGMLLGAFNTYVSRPTDSDHLIEQYEQGNDIYGTRVEITVQKKDWSVVVGEYLWEERTDVSYVTFDRVNLDLVGVGDTVVVVVNDIVKTMGGYMIIIEDVEVYFEESFTNGQKNEIRSFSSLRLDLRE